MQSSFESIGLGADFADVLDSGLGADGTSRDVIEICDEVRMRLLEA